MLRKFLRKDADGFGRAEEAAVARVAGAHGRLVVEGGHVNTKSDGGYSACARFLDDLDAAAKALGLEPAPRKYRASFTINYRALLSDELRNYRVDVLEASVEQYTAIWVNGDKFEFSAEAMRRAEALQENWAGIGTLLSRWGGSGEHSRSCRRPCRTELREALSSFDVAWASFEHKYIAELIEIEEKARSLVVEAIKHERAMQKLEADYGEEEACQMPSYREERKQLVACVGRLNSVANFKRKGRDDLAADVMEDARKVLDKCEARSQASCLPSRCHGEEGDGLRVLAADVLETFANMRLYLREVARCLERVDPHLCNNAGLVARLVDWEETWEVGARYLQHPLLLEAVCDLVGEILAAQRLVPALAAMCSDCDVELFLCLPRLAWLRFCAEPACLSELLRVLVPHRFASPSGDRAEYDAQVAQFVARFRRTREMIGDAVLPSGKADATDSTGAAWSLLVRRVVAGSDGTEDIYGGVPRERRVAVAAEVEELMHELERWSIELQRHCPEDWNQCAALLVQCLGGGQHKDRQSQFHV